jgi:hypothetical protein
MAKIRIIGKRRAYILTFDRDDNIDYLKFHNNLVALNSIETWFHYLKSSYILISKYSATQITNDILNLIPGKRFIVIELNLKNRNGILPNEAWNWVQKYEDEISKASPNLLI